QVAEIFAALKALEIVDEVWTNVGMMEVMLVSDSEYVVKSMCEYIWKWLRIGFKASTGKKVENGVLLKQLHERIGQLSEEGLEVKLWHVKRKMNQNADRLANAALDSLRT
ncbi:ribonuclease H-like domain-containing protein, partial [Terfezia claveryi]